MQFEIQNCYSPPAATSGLCGYLQLELAFQIRDRKLVPRDRQPPKFDKVLFYAFNLTPFNFIFNFLFPRSTVPIFEVMALCHEHIGHLLAEKLLILPKKLYQYLLANC